jgi:apolipoprotein N-acyltransferase
VREASVVWRALTVLLLLVLVAVVGVGFYREWFSVATSSDPETGRTAVQLNIDQDKMKSDAQKAKQKVTGVAGVAGVQEQSQGK